MLMWRQKSFPRSQMAFTLSSLSLSFSLCVSLSLFSFSCSLARNLNNPNPDLRYPTRSASISG